jgi:hypothetical protein
MPNKSLLSDPKYDPSKLLDFLIHRKELKNDAGLSRALKVATPVISKIRNKRLAIGDSMLVKMHDLTDLPIKIIRFHMGIGAP